MPATSPHRFCPPHGPRATPLQGKPRRFPRAAYIFSSSASALNSPHPIGNRAPSHPVNPVHPVQKIPSLPPSAPPRLRGNSPFGCGSAALWQWWKSFILGKISGYHKERREHKEIGNKVAQCPSLRLNQIDCGPAALCLLARIRHIERFITGQLELRWLAPVEVKYDEVVFPFVEPALGHVHRDSLR